MEIGYPKSVENFLINKLKRKYSGCLVRNEKVADDENLAKVWIRVPYVGKVNFSLNLVLRKFSVISILSNLLFFTTLRKYSTLSLTKIKFPSLLAVMLYTKLLVPVLRRHI